MNRRTAIGVGVIVALILAYGVVSVIRSGVIERDITGRDATALVSHARKALTAMEESSSREGATAFRQMMTAQLRAIETPRRLEELIRSTKSTLGVRRATTLYSVTRHFNRKIVRFEATYSKYPVVYLQFYFPLEQPYLLAGFRIDRDQPRDPR